MKPILIYGAGGFGRGVLGLIQEDLGLKVAGFIDDKKSMSTIHGVPVNPISFLNPRKYAVVMAIGDPHTRYRLVMRLPSDTEFPTLIHPSVILSKKQVWIGRGSIILPYTIIRSDTVIGDFSNLSISTVFGHDCTAGLCFTTAPFVGISGRCKIGRYVRFLSNSCAVESLNIGDNTLIAAGSALTKSTPNYSYTNLFAGVPAKWKKSYEDPMAS